METEAIKASSFLINPIDSTQTEKYPSPWTRRYTPGSKFGVLGGAISALVLCLINVSAIIWAVYTHGLSSDGEGMLYEGDCARAKSLSVAIHLIINVASTLLLGASNYSM
jgi:hypothetical protein